MVHSQGFKSIVESISRRGKKIGSDTKSLGGLAEWVRVASRVNVTENEYELPHE